MDIGTLTGTVSLEDQLSGALTVCTDKVKSFAEEFDGAMGAVAISLGVVATGVTAVTGAVIALGVAGSDVNDVKSTFEHFSGSVEQSVTTLEALRAGTHNVITDFDLMKSSSQMLAAGTKLTSDEFKTLGDAAFAMQNRGLGSTKEMLDLVSTAMVTGRTRALSLKLGIVDNTDALKEYAEAHNIYDRALTRAETSEANRITVMKMLSSVTKDAGVQQLDFGEKIEAVGVKFKNWFHDLSSVVAESPHVTTMIDSIVKSLGGSIDGATLMQKVSSAIDQVADSVTAAIPYVESFGRAIKTMFGILSDTFSFISDHIELFEDLGVGVGIFLLATQGVPTAMTAATTAMGFFTGGVTAAEVELENLKLALLGLPESTLVATTGFEAATASMSAFLIASGPMIVAIAGISAAVAIGHQAWALWSERSAQASSDAKQLTIDQGNLATINKTLGTHFTVLSDAVKAANERAAQLRATIVPLTEAEKLDEEATKQAAERKKVYDDAVKKVVDSVKVLNDQQNVSRDAYTKLGNAVLLSADAQKQFVSAMDKVIETGRQLTEAESKRYDMITTNRLLIQNQGQEMLRVKDIRLEDIQAMKAQGFAESEIATHLGTTVGALKNYETEMKAVRDLRRELTDLEAKETKTSAQQAIDQHKREFDDAVAMLNKQSALYMTQYDLLDQVRKKKDAQELVDMSAMQTARDNSLQETADRTYRTYSDMAAHASKYSRETLEEWRQKVYDTQQAVFGLGAAHDKMADSAIQKITATTAAQVGWNASIMETHSMAESVNMDLENQIANVRTLSGEYITAAKAKERFMMGSTMAVTALNLHQMLDSIVTSSTWSLAGPNDQHGLIGREGDADYLARKGYSFEEIVKYMTGQAKLSEVPTGPSIPGYDMTKASTDLDAAFGIAVKGAKTTTTAIDSMNTAMTATTKVANVMTSTFDQLNSQQAAMYRAGGNAVTGTSAYQDILTAMKTAPGAPDWAVADGLSNASTPGVVPNPVGTPYMPTQRYGYAGSNIPSGPVTIQLNVDGQVLAKVTSDNIFNKLGLKY